METISKRLIFARQQAGLSQKELARRVGAVPATIQAIESGRTQSSGKLLAIATALNVRPEWLANGTGTITNDGTQITVAESLPSASTTENQQSIDIADGITESELFVLIHEQLDEFLDEMGIKLEQKAKLTATFKLMKYFIAEKKLDKQVIRLTAKLAAL